MSKYRVDIDSFMVRDNLEGLIRYVGVLPELSSALKEKLFAIRGRLSKLESDRAIGVLSQDDYSKERNQIRYALLQITTSLEQKVEEIESKAKKKEKFILAAKKFALPVVGVIALIIVLKLIFGYISYRSNINLPRKYFKQVVTKEHVRDLYDIILVDSSLGNERFNDQLNFLYGITDGKTHYIDFNEHDSTYWNEYLVPPEEFDLRTNELFYKFSSNGLTFGDIYLECNYIDELDSNILLDSLNKEYQIIDNCCNEIQDYINRKIEMSNRIKRLVDVGFMNLKIDKGRKEISTNITIQNGLGETIYYVRTRHFAVEYSTGDTLISLTSQVNNSTGIGAVYENLEMIHSWNQPYIYNKIKNYEKTEFYIIDQVVEINVGGENYDLYFDYRPTDLPFSGVYYSNDNYTSPSELNGQCPYLRYDNEILLGVRARIESLFAEYRHEKDYFYTDYMNEFSVMKE